MSVPQLRFKDKAGKDFPAWEIKLIGAIAEVTTGDKDTQNKVEDGAYADAENEAKAAKRGLNVKGDVMQLAYQNALELAQKRGEAITENQRGRMREIYRKAFAQAVEEAEAKDWLQEKPILKKCIVNLGQKIGNRYPSAPDAIHVASATDPEKRTSPDSPSPSLSVSPFHSGLIAANSLIVHLEPFPDFGYRVIVFTFVCRG